MFAKAYPRQLSQLENSILLLKDELLKLREAATQLRGVDYSRLGVGVSSVPGSVMENRIIMQMKHEEKIQREIESLLKRKQTIISRIFRLDNPKYSRLLFLLYAKEQTLTEAADEIGISYDYARHIHQKALRDFARQTGTYTLQETTDKNESPIRDTEETVK